MGKVYAWDDVEAQRIPHLDEFPVVINQMRNVFEREESILGALVCGSVLRGDHTRRSDIDCVVIYDTCYEREAMYNLQELSMFAGKKYVPLGIVPCDSYTASTRFHHLGPAFRVHLQTAIAGGGIIKVDPLQLLGSGGNDMIAEVEDYLRMQVYRMEEGLAKYCNMPIDRQCDFLQKVLEAPLHVARKILHLFANESDDSKEAISKRYLKAMPFSLGEMLSRLITFDKLYTVELLQQLDSPNKKRYEDFWEDLEEQFPYQVLHFVRSNISHLEETRR